ncbi:MAG TPA: 2-keto-4-pentenoate hydratase [Burkholderiaceae bacterium]|jgi:2-keto-4-pentenoate hydratase
MSHPPVDRAGVLAARLAAAQQACTLIDAPTAEESPVDAQEAYDIQHRALSLRGETAVGWKVGAKSPSGPIQGAPLPSIGVRMSPASMNLSHFATCGLELEIAFRFGRSFKPRAQAYDDEEVFEGIASMMAAIEIVSTRYVGWPGVDKLAQLADLQNHGALIVGEPIPYQSDFPFMAPRLSFHLDRVDVLRGAPANPAGDPRRLLPWLVNHASSRGLTISSDIVVTTGSYAGMHFAKNPGTANGDIEGLPSVQVDLI